MEPQALTKHPYHEVKKQNAALLGVLLILTLILIGCDKDIHNHPHLTTGKQFFQYHCSECHGPSGEGIFILGVPANRDTKLSVSQVVHRIQRQDAGKMPDFVNMPEDEAIRIAVYLKEINKPE